MKRRALFLIIISIITIKAGFSQDYPNLVKNGDFEDGVVGFKSDFIYHSDDLFTWGYYVVTDNVAQYLAGGVFINPVPKTGKYFAIDMNNSGKQRIWYDSITVKPNTTYQFSCFGANVVNDFVAPGVMNLKVNGKQICPAKTLSNGSSAWKPLSIKYKTGPEETRIEISIVDEIWTLSGNDVAIDNVVFKEIPPEEYTSSCKQEFPKGTTGVAETGNDPVVIAIQSKFVEERKEEEIKKEEIKKEEERKKVEAVTVKAVIKDKVVEEVKVEEVKVEEVKVEEVKVEEVKVEEVKVKEKPVLVIVAPEKKKVIVQTVTVPIKKSDLPAVEVKKKIEIAAPEEKKKIITPVTVKKTEPKVFSSNIKITDVKKNDTLKMSHINFEKGTYHLLPTSIPELKDLVKFMKENTTVRIRLEGHTESGGDPKKNKVLSENRVIEVKKYLVDNGIETGRIEWLGHGGEKPLYVGDDEERKKLNRRVEVIVVSK